MTQHGGECEPWVIFPLFFPTWFLPVHLQVMAQITVPSSDHPQPTSRDSLPIIMAHSLPTLLPLPISWSVSSIAISSMKTDHNFGSSAEHTVMMNTARSNLSRHSFCKIKPKFLWKWCYIWFPVEAKNENTKPHHYGVLRKLVAKCKLNDHIFAIPIMWDLAEKTEGLKTQ